MLPKLEVPYIWDDVLIEDKSLVINIQQENIEFSFEHLEKPKKYRINEDLKVLFSTVIENKNITRVLKITDIGEEEDEEELYTKYVKKEELGNEFQDENERYGLVYNKRKPSRAVLYFYV